MTDHEKLMIKYLLELNTFILKSAENLEEKRILEDTMAVLKRQLTLGVGRRIIKETYKNA